jgi:hypothetical protein
MLTRGLVPEKFGFSGAGYKWAILWWGKSKQNQQKEKTSEIDQNLAEELRWKRPSIDYFV